MTTTEDRIYQYGDRVTWPDPVLGMQVGITVRPEEGQPRPDPDLDAALVLADGDRTSVWLPYSALDYAPPIEVGSRVVWNGNGHVCRGQVVDPTEFRWSTEEKRKLDRTRSVAVIPDGASTPIVQYTRGMRVLDGPSDIARRHADALLAAVRTAERAAAVIAQEGVWITAHGTWEPGDFTLGIEAQEDFDAELVRVQEALRSISRMARIAGGQR